MSFVSLNPTTNQVIQTYASWDAQRLERALEQAHSAQQLWAQTSLARRAKILGDVATQLRAQLNQYAALITREMGKPLREARAEVEKCAVTCDYYAQHGADFLRAEPVESDAGKSYIAYYPLGVVLAIMPWNFPFWQVFRFAAPALMAGNVGVLKHASNVPQCALAIEEVFRRAGFPRGVFQTLLVESGAVARISGDERIAAATLTGSEPAGVQVAATAGRHLKKVVLELGGSDPFIVLRDADLERACSVATQARVINSGQSCIAAKRFIVEQPIAKDFTAGFVEKMRSLRVGDPMDEATEVGPLARPDLVAELDRQVRRSLRKGARLLTGGKRLPGPGCFYAPTVLAGVRPGMPAYDEEIFGPVASVIVARDADDAVRVANDSRFGLGASLWSRDVERATALARRIAAGLVFVNDLVKSDPRLPFGGVKKSGFGRELGAYGIKEFVNIKTLVVH